jgi:uncharacterized protein involved in exopolysaccharide biosynthesis
MDGKSHAVREIADQENVLARRDDELILEEELHDLRSRERTVARLRLLWTHRRFLAKVLAVGLIASSVIAFVIPSSYESTARLMPPDEQSPSLGLLTGLLGSTGSGATGGLASLAGGVLGLKTSGDLFIGVLGSRTVQDDLISKFDLRKTYGVHSWEAARKKLQGRTDVSSDRKSGIITIQVTDRSPRRAAAMAEEYVAELSRVVTNVNTSSAHRERVFLEGRLSEVKQDLESAENNFSQFASKNTAINIPEQGKAMIAAAAELEGQLIAAQTQLESLKQVYTDRNVRVRETQARVDELRRQLAKMGGKPGADNTADPQDAEAIYPSIRQLPVLGVNYADLYRQTKIEEAVFEGLTQQYELAKVEEVKATPSVKVLDQANEPEKKSFPPRFLISLGGTLFAGTLGVLWVFGNENWRQIDPQDPGKVLTLEVLENLRPYVFLQSLNGSSGKAFSTRFWERLTKRRSGNAESLKEEDRE